MPDDDLLSRLERERANADRAYNDALTALDAALVRAGTTDAAALPRPAPPGQPPSGWRGPMIRAVREWLAPWVDAQQAFNVRIGDAIQALEARDHERAVAFERFQHALMGFLQQITAFVETKERQLAQSGAVRREVLSDLQSQVAVLQRATQMLTRAAAVPVGTGAQPAAMPVDVDAYKYVGFEDQFRGSVDEIRAKLTDFLPIFAGTSDVLDVGCGRGEFLALLQQAGVAARGVDSNSAMVATARERGLDAIAADALEYLTSLPDESLGGLFSSQVVEHLQPTYLMRLLAVAFHKLRPGAPIVLETINPTCWLAFFSSYLRDLTHVKPIHPDTLEYLTRASGFANVAVRYRAPVPDQIRLRSIDLPVAAQSTDAATRLVAEVARVVNENAAILNSLAFSNQDYAVVGYRS